MLFERIVSEGIAHYSYLIGDKNEALVIDPRRDCNVYVEKASPLGMRIVHILETHRNEDYLIGSLELSNKTGAKIWHADSQWNYKYGSPVQPGQKWKVGRLEIEAIPTPGHTPGSMSYLLRDPDGLPWIVFSGDALFAGDVGRIDLMGQDMANEMASLLYCSLYEKILPLGDEVIVCPSHGSGSVCGESIAERLWTTIGLERKHNIRLLNGSKEEFVADLIKSQPDRPPYFSRMEELNLEGEPLLSSLPTIKPLAPKDFQDLAEKSQVIDTRTELEFGAAHPEGAQFIWQEGLASFAGWFISYDKPILMVTKANNPKEEVSILFRLGFDKIIGYLAGGMLNWHMSGRDSVSIRTITVQELSYLIDKDESIWILDVRSDSELEEDGQIAGAHHIHITEVSERIDEIPKNKSVHVFCGSGMRSMIVASFLRAKGWNDPVVILGGMAAWRSNKYPLELLQN